MNKKKIKKNNKKATIKNNIKLLINKYKSSSKKVKIAITSSFVAFILLLIFIIFYNVNINLKANANISVSPDSKFDDVNLYKCVVKQYYKNKTPDYTHVFKTTELESLTTLTCNSSNVTSTKGIELMKNLQYLDLQNNNITSLSVVTNTKLIQLNASNNNLTSIAIHKNPKLVNLYLTNNNLVDIQLYDQITSLQRVYLSNNSLTNINETIKNLSNLKILYVDHNNLTDLSVVNNLALETLIASKNQLTSIDLHNNGSLKHINFNNNKLTSIKMRNGVKNLEEIHLKNNQLTSIDLSIQTNLKTLDLSGNSLSSINLDNNRKLETLYLGMDTDSENYGNNITELSVVNNPYLKYLNAPNNKITDIRIHSNNYLEYVNLNNNELTSARFDTQVDNLKELYLMNNKLTSIDVEDATELTILKLFNNLLPSVDLSKNTKLTYLSLAGNQLTSINLDNNKKLETLLLGYDKNGLKYGNELTELNLSHHHNLVKLFASHNKLTSIGLHLNESLVKVDLQDNELTEALFYDNVKAIKQLYLQNNKLAHLDLSALTALQEINLTEAFTEKININQNDRYDLITLPNNSNLNYAVKSIKDNTIVSKDGTTIVGNNEGKTQVKYYVPGNTTEQITYIVGNPEESSNTCEGFHTVTWIVDGRSIGTTNNIECGKAISDTHFSNTVRKYELEGHTFKFWSTSLDEEDRFYFNTPIESDLTLYAIFEDAVDDETVTTKTVTFYKTNNEIYLTKDVEYGKTLEAPENPVLDGFTFNYWKLENVDTAFDFSTPITSDINLYADYTITDNYKLLDELIINYTTSNDNDSSQSVSGGAFNLEDSYTFTINNLTSEKAEVEVVPKESDTDISGDKGKITLTSGENNFQVVLKKGSVTETYNYKVIATFADDNSSSSTTDGTGTSNGTCRGILSSSKYEVNNDSLVVGKVPQTESNETILKNIIADCGTVTVYDDSIVIVYNNQTKTYKINRYWSPQTGIKVIKYGLILGIIFVITLGLILINKKIRKKW